MRNPSFATAHEVLNQLKYNSYYLCKFENIFRYVVNCIFFVQIKSRYSCRVTVLSTNQEYMKTIIEILFVLWDFTNLKICFL